MRGRFLALAAVVVFTLAAPSPARASHHLWRLSQIYSNASGSVQFIELELQMPFEDGENSVGGVQISSSTNTITLPADLPGLPTSTHPWVLLATSNFAGLHGGVTPDYVIPANFFPTGGGTINYALGTDTWTYGAVPTDGENALHKSGATVTTSANSPENFNNQSGQVFTGTVPALSPRWIALLVGALLLAGSGLMKEWRRRTPAR
jgi:hypothetical protein